MEEQEREEMISELIKKDIEMIRDGLNNNDTEYLDNILRGNGWKQYNNLTDEELQTEFRENRIENYPLGCGEFDSKNPELTRSCGDILFSNKIWLCDKCRKKNYTQEQKKVIERGEELK